MSAKRVEAAEGLLPVAFSFQRRKATKGRSSPPSVERQPTHDSVYCHLCTHTQLQNIV